MTRESMVFYRGFAEGIAQLEKEDQLECLWAIINYGLYGTEPEEKGVAKAMFMLAKPQIDANNQRYKNGKKGGRPQTNEEPEGNHAEPNHNQEKPNDNQTETKAEPKHENDKPNVNDNVNVNVNVNDNVIDYQQIADMYNDTCVSFPRLTRLSDRRRRAIKARINGGYTLDDFHRLFNMAENSDFLKGSNGRNWSATFDWLIQDGNMAKVLDGNYQSREPTQKGENHDTGGKDTGYDGYLRDFIESGGKIPEFTGF